MLVEGRLRLVLLRSGQQTAEFRLTQLGINLTTTYLGCYLSVQVTYRDCSHTLSTGSTSARRLNHIWCEFPTFFDLKPSSAPPLLSQREWSYHLIGIICFLVAKNLVTFLEEFPEKKVFLSLFFKDFSF